MFRVMLVDDEPPARRSLRRLLGAHEDMDIAGEAGSLAEARLRLPELKPDLIFLDVELGDGKGLEMLGAEASQPEVIFVTAYSRYAVDAFDVAAADFLVKPVEPQRLSLALQRLRERRSLQAAPEPRLRIHLPGQHFHIPHDRLLALTAEGDFTRIALLDGKDLLVCRLLGQFEAELSAPSFRRLSRSLIVNMDQVRRVETLQGGRARLILGEQGHAVMLGRTALRRFRDQQA
ncbi:hypothetical protein SZ64_10510 [Erythrobacter sp. SG61-1L]|uniref:LytR/AlgR family response regulator transcription factor n=1 Tax=Erythrobacter sp. SG61-1L TaxID=1603897 RepID=UPI0006C93484|nr:LytTR family DNA-binding domain-containing protein [Erythrobacter sp. SG61-1L]KPL68497.1 hypothetical protein SZ64_10510 [Erythrobacter sp. SG61-1L]